MQIVHGDFFRSVSHHIHDDRTLIPFNPNGVKENDLIFVKTDFIDSFFNNYYNLIPCGFRIITHNSDYHIHEVHLKYLHLSKLNKWYAQNNMLVHEKMVSIPIGVANPMWSHGNQYIINKVNDLEIKKEKLLYVNFNVETNPSHRVPVWNMFSSNEYTTKEKDVDFETYLKTMRKHTFVISPLGNGNDCHRIYESLFLGVIPIVPRFKNCDVLYKDMSVLFVDDFSEVTYEFLLEKQKEFSEIKRDKIFSNYWLNILNND